MGRPRKAPAAQPAPETHDAGDEFPHSDQALYKNLSKILASAAGKSGADARAPAGQGSGQKAAAGKVQTTPAAGLTPLNLQKQSAVQRVNNPTDLSSAGGARVAAGSAGAGKRIADQQAAGARKQARPASGARAPPAASVPEPPIATDRNGIPTPEGLRSWAAAKLEALQERAAAGLGRQCSKAIEDGYNAINATVTEHQAAMSAMLSSSNEALEMARNQHTSALAEIESLRDGLLDETEAELRELQSTLRSEVVAPMERNLAALQAKYKI